MLETTPGYVQAHMGDLRRSGGSAENAIHRSEAVAEPAERDMRGSASTQSASTTHLSVHRPDH